jgi:hypothetical protein
VEVGLLAGITLLLVGLVPMPEAVERAEVGEPLQPVLDERGLALLLLMVESLVGRAVFQVWICDELLDAAPTGVPGVGIDAVVGVTVAGAGWLATVSPCGTLSFFLHQQQQFSQPAKVRLAATRLANVIPRPKRIRAPFSANAKVP